MFVVITPERNPNKEVEFLIKFSSFSDVRLHIRKPHFSEIEMARYLNALPEKVLAKSSLHSHHKLAEEFAVGGVHFTTRQRDILKTSLAKEVGEWKQKEKIVSASLHDLQEDCSLWDYAFLSPVFNSISKKNYEGKTFSVVERSEKWIALGGITCQNIPRAKELGYKGITVLGSVWESATIYQSFEKLYNEYQKYFT